jgi:S1-C subfamily serine protease
MPLDVPTEVREKLELGPDEGVFVAQVQPGAPANRAGLKYGDVILQWNGRPATDPTLLSREIAATEIGSNAKLLLVRNADGENKQITLDIKVEAHPDN